MLSDLLSFGGILTIVALLTWTWLVGVLTVAVIGGVLEEFGIVPRRDGGGR